MTSEEYKKKYQQQLQTGRRIWLEEYQKPRKGDTANIEQTVQALIQNLEEKERKEKHKFIINNWSRRKEKKQRKSKK